MKKQNAKHSKNSDIVCGIAIKNALNPLRKTVDISHGAILDFFILINFIISKK